LHAGGHGFDSRWLHSKALLSAIFYWLVQKGECPSKDLERPEAVIAGFSFEVVGGHIRSVCWGVGSHRIDGVAAVEAGGRTVEIPLPSSLGRRVATISARSALRCGSKRGREATQCVGQMARRTVAGGARVGGRYRRGRRANNEPVGVALVASSAASGGDGGSLAWAPGRLTVRAAADLTVGRVSWPPRVGQLLPRVAEAVGVCARLSDYSLNPENERGTAKAGGFALTLGVALEDVDHIEAKICAGILTTPVSSIRKNGGPPVLRASPR